MTRNNQAGASTTDLATTENTGPKPRRRRMAREPLGPDQLPGARAARVAAGNKPRGPSKIAAVITLLERPEGATLAEMVEATSWLPHTTRAALTGLKKKGHAITRDKRDKVTCYRIAKAG